MDNLEIKKAILQKIKEFDSIIIVRHIRPDGDCIGSSLGLRNILRESFPDKKIYSIGKGGAEYLSFLGTEDEEVSVDTYKESLVIAVDTSVKDRIDNDNVSNAKYLIKIDHHLNVDPYGDIVYVRDDFPAACCIIADFYDTFKDELKMTREGASALFCGIATDTGRFRYSGVSKRTFELAGMLLEFGVDTEYLYSHLYIKESGVLKLEGWLLNHYKETENGVAYIHITRKIIKKFNLTYEEAASLINSLDSIKGKLIWIAFIDLEDSIRVRIRSRYVPCVSVGQKYRGGGHPNACGATVYNKKEIKELLAFADGVVKEYKENNEGWL